jgi:GNAT superfamily N-acetyltransferase
MASARGREEKSLTLECPCGEPPFALRRIRTEDGAGRYPNSHPGDEPELAPALADVLIDCVEGGASVSFMWPLPRHNATAFWQSVIDSARRSERILLVAEDVASSTIVGTVQVIFAIPENQPHRADVAKMLVHRRARRHGLGTALMRAAEDAARSAGKTLLVLDTVTGGDAERLYARLGWQRCGEIPGYALFPRGGLCSTTYFYKQLI